MNPCLIAGGEGVGAVVAAAALANGVGVTGKVIAGAVGISGAASAVNCGAAGITSARMLLFNRTFSETERTKMKWILIAGGVGVGVVVAAPLVLSAVGFGDGGIVPGSVAAKMMSAAALANGGGVAAGGTVPVLQSFGAVGISWTTLAAIGTVATIVTISLI